MKEQTPLLILSRQTIAHMGAAKVALDTLASASVTTAGVSGLSSVLAGTKIELMLPIVASIVGAGSLLCRAVLSYYMGVSITSNPINTSARTTVSIPEPITPSPDVQPTPTPS